MLGISLVLIGIAFTLNGLIVLCNWDKRGIATINALIGFFLVIVSTVALFGSVSTITTLISFGQLLFGFTLLYMASDLIWGTDKKAFAFFCILLAVCAITLAVFFILNDLVFLGILWAIWSFIWIFLFVGFGATGKFRSATFYCLIVEGIIALMATGFLHAMNIINILS